MPIYAPGAPPFKNLPTIQVSVPPGTNMPLSGGAGEVPFTVQDFSNTANIYTFNPTAGNYYVQVNQAGTYLVIIEGSVVDVFGGSPSTYIQFILDLLYVHQSAELVAILPGVTVPTVTSLLNNSVSVCGIAILQLNAGDPIFADYVLGESAGSNDTNEYNYAKLIVIKIG